MGGLDDNVDRRIAKIATATHGVVSRQELLCAGVTAREIEGRLASGRLIAAYRGVYRVGHLAPSVEARYMAAVKAGREGAVLSGLAAAYLLGLIKGLGPPPEVTAPRLRDLRGVRLRRSRRVEAMTFRRIPVTTVARTLVDVAGALPEDQLAKACHEAGVRFGTTPRHVTSVLARRSNSRGAAKLKRIISGDTPILLSKLEKGFRRLLRQAGKPLPETNRPVDAHYVDCRWPKHRLTVELDSYTFHNSRHSWEQGFRREREARSHGDEFRRYAWGDVFETPRRTLAELSPLLAE